MYGQYSVVSSWLFVTETANDCDIKFKAILKICMAKIKVG